MKSWRLRALLIFVVAGLVAVILPGVRESIEADKCLDGGGSYDYAAQTCNSGRTASAPQRHSMIRLPDAGSVFLALIVAVAIARLFVTMDRRARARSRRSY